MKRLKLLFFASLLVPSFLVAQKSVRLGAQFLNPIQRPAQNPSLLNQGIGIFITKDFSTIKQTEIGLSIGFQSHYHQIRTVDQEVGIKGQLWNPSVFDQVDRGNIFTQRVQTGLYHLAPLSNQNALRLAAYIGLDLILYKVEEYPLFQGEKSGSSTGDVLNGLNLEFEASFRIKQKMEFGLCYNAPSYIMQYRSIAGPFSNHQLGLRLAFLI